MKNNVITHSRMVQFGSNGSLEIIGKTKEFQNSCSVVFMAKGDMAQNMFYSPPDFCKKCITSWMPDGSGIAILIFEYSLRSELRNPQKLLKSVRNKLMQAINAEHQQRETEYFESYVQPGLNDHNA